MKQCWVQKGSSMLLHLLEVGQESGNRSYGMKWGLHSFVPCCSRLCDAHRTGMLAWADEEAPPKSLVCEDVLGSRNLCVPQGEMEPM